MRKTNKQGAKLKKYLKTNMAIARIEKRNNEVKGFQDSMNHTIVDTQNNTMCMLNESAIASQEFSTATTNQLFQPYRRINSKSLLRKCESLENITANTLNEENDSPKALNNVKKEVDFEWMKTFDVRSLLNTPDQ